MELVADYEHQGEPPTLAPTELHQPGKAPLPAPDGPTRIRRQIQKSSPLRLGTISISGSMKLNVERATHSGPGSGEASAPVRSTGAHGRAPVPPSGSLIWRRPKPLVNPGPAAPAGQGSFV